MLFTCCGVRCLLIISTGGPFLLSLTHGGGGGGGGIRSLRGRGVGKEIRWAGGWRGWGSWGWGVGLWYLPIDSAVDQW